MDDINRFFISSMPVLMKLQSGDNCSLTSLDSRAPVEMFVHQQQINSAAQLFMCVDVTNKLHVIRYENVHGNHSCYQNTIVTAFTSVTHHGKLKWGPL